MRGRTTTRLGLAALAFAALTTAMAADDPELVEPRGSPMKLAPPAAFVAEDDVVVVEISEYAGYAGLIVANGGLEPNPDSVFAKKYGFRVRLTVSEAESWSALNAGHIAAAPTTVDVLAVYGSQLSVKVPVLLGFSRGADGIVVTRDIRGINALKGKRLAACQYTEADFFLRYLAQEASLPVKALAGPDAPADPEALNLVFTADAFGSGDLFARDLAAGRGRLAGCVTWDPKTGEVVDGSAGKARLLATNRNLLIIADVLLVNGGFAAAKPEWVGGLARGALEGNARVRADARVGAAALAKAFGWTEEDAVLELGKVHLANYPENLAFFADRLDDAGGFSFIYDTALDVYGSAISRQAANPESFPLPEALSAANSDGAFGGEAAAIAAVGDDKGVRMNAESDALLSTNLFFYFDPNSAKLTPARAEENAGQLDVIRRWLRVSPGSRVLLRGHADGSRLPDIERDGGPVKAREARVILRSLSRERCLALREALVERYGLAVERVEIRAVGADEPTGEGPDADRRVEAQWFTLE